MFSENTSQQFSRSQSAIHPGTLLSLQPDGSYTSSAAPRCRVKPTFDEQRLEAGIVLTFQHAEIVIWNTGLSATPKSSDRLTDYTGATYELLRVAYRGTKGRYNCEAVLQVASR